MIAIVVEGGVVQAVYSDNPDERAMVLDLDDADESPLQRYRVQNKIEDVQKKLSEISTEGV